jgi:hypothetical protein
VVKSLLSKGKALRSNSSTTKTQNKIKNTTTTKTRVYWLMSIIPVTQEAEIWEECGSWLALAKK